VGRVIIGKLSTICLTVRSCVRTVGPRCKCVKTKIDMYPRTFTLFGLLIKKHVQSPCRGSGLESLGRRAALKR
jgi:hypothetical protein